MTQTNSSGVGYELTVVICHNRIEFLMAPCLKLHKKKYFMTVKMENKYIQII